MARIFKPKYPKLGTVNGPDAEPVIEERVAKHGKNKGQVRPIRKREPVLDRHGKPTCRPSRKWDVEYTDAQGVHRKGPGYTDKTATRQLAATLERQVAQEQAGIIQVSHEHLKAPVDQHIEDWFADLERLVPTP